MHHGKYVNNSWRLLSKNDSLLLKIVGLTTMPTNICVEMKMEVDVEFEDTVRELFKGVMQDIPESGDTELCHKMKELEWKVLCSYRMNNQQKKLPSFDLRLRQLIPVEIHDLNASLHS
jgi:hypothetical protein